MNQDLRNRIRYRLSSLQSDNEENLFEQVCAALARRRLHANIKMSALVAGRGDRGRDFQNVPGQAEDLVGSWGREDGLKPQDSIVGACTLGRSDPLGKIRGDVRTIHANGPKPDRIYYFCEQDIAETEQSDLRQECLETYDTRLYIVTGNDLAGWLCDDDLAGPRKLLGLASHRPIRCVLPPLNTEGFVGRGSELEFLTRVLIDGETPAEGRILGIYGPPGVGKSGLAVHFAQLNRDRFPDGVFGVDLRGVEGPVEVLARLAVASGDPLSADEQGTPAHQIAQERFAHRQCLILLDNLEHAGALRQIRPGGRAALLITCRDQDVLVNFAVPADNQCPVKSLERTEAISYLRSALGSTLHSQNELDHLAGALRELPLALRIGVRRVLEDPIVRGRIERFVTRLQAPIQIGELIVKGDDDLNLGRLFGLSLEVLSESDQHAFACLSACSVRDFGSRAAAAAMNRWDPMKLLSRLARLSLLEVDQATSRFRFHALVDDYARHLADRWNLTLEARNRHAQAMADLLRANADSSEADLPELLAEQEDIRHGIEHFVEIASVDLALLQGLGRLVEQTALGEWHSSLLLRLRQRIGTDSEKWLEAVLLLQQGKRDFALGRAHEALKSFEQSLEIHGKLKNQRGESMVLISLAGVLRDLGRLDEALAALERTLKVVEALGDSRGKAMALNSLGGALRDAGRWEEARVALEKSLKIFETLSNQRGEAMVLNSLGGVLRDLEQRKEALAAFERSLGLGVELGDQRHQAMALNSMGGLLKDLGRLEEARAALERSLRIRVAGKDERGEAMVLNSLGGLLRDLGEVEDALSAFERSLELGDKLGERRHQAIVLHSLGGLFRDLGRVEEACAGFEKSLELGIQVGDKRHQAMVLHSMGALYRELGRLEEAREAFERSLRIGASRNDQRQEALVLMSLGGLLRKLGRLEEARSAVERSLEISILRGDQRLEATLLGSLGEILRDQGRLEEARAPFERSLEFFLARNDQRRQKKLLNNLGDLLRDMGRLQEARLVFERSLGLGVASSDQLFQAVACYKLGMLHRELGEPAAALELFEKSRMLSKDLDAYEPAFMVSELKTLRNWSNRILEGSKTLAHYHFQFGKKRASAQDWLGAILHFRRSLELEPQGAEWPDRADRLAFAYFRAHRLADACEMYRLASEEGQLSPVGCANFGRALHQTGGDPEEAEKFLRRACELQPENAWAAAWLGLLLADIGQLEEGESQARRALEIQESAVLTHYLAQVQARYPDDRREKLQDALENCVKSAALADFPFPWPTVLATELKQRLG